MRRHVLVAIGCALAAVPFLPRAAGAPPSSIHVGGLLVDDQGDPWIENPELTFSVTTPGDPDGSERRETGTLQLEAGGVFRKALSHGVLPRGAALEIRDAQDALLFGPVPLPLPGTPHAVLAHETSSLAPTHPVTMGGFRLRGVGAPVVPDDAAVKQTVDDAFAGVTEGPPGPPGPAGDTSASLAQHAQNETDLGDLDTRVGDLEAAVAILQSP